MNSCDPLICYSEFLGGIMRPVYEDAVGQYVIDDDGEQVRGVWFIPPNEADEATIVQVGPSKV
jgi:hypothetical protein